MLIAIDFDDTLTADGELWRLFIENARALDHSVICITARRQTDENEERVRDWLTMHGIKIPVYFTGLASKIEFAKKRGLRVDIWIDDDPTRCVNGY